MAPAEPTRKRGGSGAGGASGPSGSSGASGSGGSGGRAHEIPDKLYFRIGEVARLCEVPAYVLRFWESEFPQLKPNKGGTGQRLYRRRDVEMALRIRTLLYDEGYTIPGARQAFKAELRSVKDPKDSQLGLEGVAEPGETRHLLALQKELRDLLAMLSKPAAPKPAVQPIRAPKEPTPQEPAARPAASSLVAFPKPRSRPAEERSDGLFDLLPPDA